MAAVLGDLIQITDWQRYLEQLVLNVYYYRVTSVSGFTNDGYEAIGDWFATNVIEEVANIQNSDLNHWQISVKNLSNGVDLYEAPLDIDGVQSGGAGASPSYVTVTYKLIRESLNTRNGYKRYAGIPESHITGNVWNVQGGSNDLAIQAALASDIVLGVVTIAEPVIVKRPINVPAGVDYIFSSIGQAASVGLGSQLTRKAGRGV